MAGVHRVIGSEESPYSVKVRAWFRYKGIEHEWLGRAQAGALYERHARLPLVPLVVTPDDRGLQDSTPLIEALERDFPTPAIHPDEPLAAFVSALLEEFGDEWGNKWMFHFRWARPVDQIGCAKRLALAMRPELAGDALEAAAATVRERMVNRVWFVGSNAGTAPQIEASYAEALGFLDAHLASRPYLFGGRPAFADFGLWGQLYNCRRDPTPRQIMESRAPNVVRWVERMLEPAAEGAFEPWSALAATLKPLLAEQVGALFLPWSSANAAAIATGADEFSVALKGHDWTQKPQKYHARSLAALKERHAAARNVAGLDELLAEVGCLDALLA